MSSSTDLAHPELKGKEVWIVDPTWDPVAKQILQYNPKGDGTYPIVRELLTGLGIIKGEILSVREISNELFAGVVRDTMKRVCDALYNVVYKPDEGNHDKVETYIHIEIQRARKSEWHERLVIYRGLISKNDIKPVKSIGLLSFDDMTDISSYTGPIKLPIFTDKKEMLSPELVLDDEIYEINLKEASKYINTDSTRFLHNEMNPVGKAWLRLLASRFMFTKKEVDRKDGKGKDEPLYKYIYNGNETDAMISILSIIGKDNVAKLNEEFRKIMYEFIERREFIGSVKELMEKYNLSAEMAVSNELSKLSMSYDDIIDILKSDYIPQFISSKKAPPEDENINNTE